MSLCSQVGNALACIYTITTTNDTSETQRTAIVKADYTEWPKKLAHFFVRLNLIKY